MTVTAGANSPSGSASPSASSPSPGATDLVISQLGITMTIPAGLTRVDYSIDSRNNVLLSTAEYTAAVSASPGYCSGPPYVQEVLEVSTDPAGPVDLGGHLPVLAHAGQYYLGLATPDGGACNDQSGAVFQQQQSLLEKMVKSARAS